MGITIFNPTRTKSYSHNLRFPIEIIFKSRKGTIWVGTQGGGLFKHQPEDNSFRQFAREIHSVRNVISSNTINDIAEDKSGNLWLATNKGLNKITPTEDGIKVKVYLAERSGLSGNVLSSVLVDSQDNLWAGTTGEGLNKIKFGLNKEFNVSIFRQNENRQWSLLNNLVHHLFEDRSGTIWVGTNNGISKFDPKKQGFVHFNFEINNKNSLNDPNVWAILEDSRGLLWVGTREGLNLIDRNSGRFYHYPRKAYNPNSLNNNSILSLEEDGQGRIWVGAVDGLFIFDLDETTFIGEYKKIKYRPDSPHLDDRRIYEIVYDKRGYLWVGSREGLSRIKLDDFSFLFFRKDHEFTSTIPDNIVRAIRVDRNNQVWIGTDNGGIAKVVEGNTLEEFDFINFVNNQTDTFSISNNMVATIWECTEQDDVLWIGTYGGGVNKFNVKENSFLRFTEENGLANNAVYGILGDNNGYLWMSTNRGLSRFNLKEMVFKNFEENDGIQSNEFNIGAYHKSQSGELFFGGINGFNAFFPDKIVSNTKEPQMAITEVLLFNKPLSIDSIILNTHISLAEEINLTYRQNNLTIEFAALHYSFPLKNTYKYIMEGLEEDTTYSGMEHKAHYTSLPPGEYTFKVWGANSDGLWASEPAKLNIIITPPFWATWWFRSVMILLIGGGIFYYYRSRLLAIKRQKEILEKLVKKRTKEIFDQKEKIEQQNKLLEAEKAKSEKLLLNILPEETAEELKTKGKASARNYRRVSVMFTDIKGFTSITEKLKPQDLVSKLDSLFIGFDEIIQKYNIEKIKTIGDSYMCAGGLPIRNQSNPIDMVLAGLEIQRYMKHVGAQISEDIENPWRLRIGIHTGDVTAGVIGTKRFAYDIWGDTVNVASRMEESGEPDTVNVSGKTYEIIEPYFVCTYRGKIPAKNKGHIDMYFVHGIKPELSVDGKGEEPNEAFWEYVNLNLYSNVNYRKAERYIVKILKKELPLICITTTSITCRMYARLLNDWLTWKALKEKTSTC
jgi:ligand-binding sensor domain-containing protein/class 3 adenylate cyclase